MSSKPARSKRTSGRHADLPLGSVTFSKVISHLLDYREVETLPAVGKVVEYRHTLAEDFPAVLCTILSPSNFPVMGSSFRRVDVTSYVRRKFLITRMIPESTQVSRGKGDSVRIVSEFPYTELPEWYAFDFTPTQNTKSEGSKHDALQESLREETGERDDCVCGTATFYEAPV